MLYHGQVMRHKQIGQPHLLLQIDKQVDNLRLDGNIQRGDRLVQHDKLRLHRQRAGNADSLALSS